MENKQSAVEWLESQFDWISNYMMEEHKEQLFNQAKAMEKEQMIKFAMHLHMVDMSKTGTDILQDEAKYYYEQYYEETFKQPQDGN